MTIKVGLVGTGGFSHKHAEILSKMDDVEITAINGTSQEKADLMAKQFGAKGYGKLDEMLDDNKLDAVYICVPPMSHGDIETKIVERQIPFFVEKPLGVDERTIKRIENDVQKNKLITSVGYHFRYSDTVNKLKGLCDQQQLGMALGYWMGSLPPVSWWKNQELSGGQMNEQTTHIVDLFRYLFGEVNEVYGVYENKVLSKKDTTITVPDVGTITMKFSNGLVANISNTCILPSGIGQVGLNLYSDEALIQWNPKQMEIQSSHGKQTVLNDLDPYIRENQLFIEAVKTGDSSQIKSPYEDAYKTFKVTDLANKSAAEGIPFKI